MSDKEIQIAINDQIAGGTYSNIAVIAHNENEFILILSLPTRQKDRLTRE